MEAVELNEDPNPNPEPPVSGAYIRSLVKHLKTKEPINPNSSSNANPSKMAEEIPKPQPTQHHKKQVRRRLHTTRPYQERLLNMAEARREIVTALKYHRAAMKKAAAAEQQLQPQTPLDPPPARSQEGKIRPRKIIKSSTTERNRIYNPQTNFSNNNNNYNNLKNLCYHPSMNCSFPTWSMNSQSMEGDNIMGIVLPEQTLGLNLNLQDFNNLDVNLFSNGGVSGSVSGFGSGSSSSSSPSLSIATDQEAPNWVSAAVSDGTESNTSGGGGGGLHVAVGEEEMAEIRSIGEKHEMEWSDKMSLVKSAWWLRFMKMGKKEEEEEEAGFGFGFGFGDQFDQILEFPDWMNNGNETCFQEQLLNDYCSNDSQFFHDDHPSSALPCMDIGEFEGMDGEWLA